MLIAKDSFILYIKGTFLFEPGEQSYTKVFQYSWSKHTN